MVGLLNALGTTSVPRGTAFKRGLAPRLITDLDAGIDCIELRKLGRLAATVLIVISSIIGLTRGIGWAVQLLRRILGMRTNPRPRAPNYWKRYSFLVRRFWQNTVLSRVTYLLMLVSLLYCAPVYANTQAPITKNSESVETPEEAWRQTGFRIGLAYEFHGLLALDYTANTVMQGFSVRPYYQFENNWSLGANLSYSVPNMNETGLRWALTLEGTWWFFDQLGVTLGAGYAGRMVQCDYEQTECERIIYSSSNFSSLEDDVWLEPGEQLDACNGGGVILSSRVEYQWTVSDYFRTGPYLQTYFESIRCAEEIGSIHPTTGRILLYFDNWSYVGASAGWWLTWR